MSKSHTFTDDEGVRWTQGNKPGEPLFYENASGTRCYPVSTQTWRSLFTKGFPFKEKA